jgi:hypothetical protein
MAIIREENGETTKIRKEVVVNTTQPQSEGEESEVDEEFEENNEEGWFLSFSFLPFSC